MNSGLLIFVSGPAGVGKSTICRRLAAELPAEFAVSATTRAGKPQDALGKKYMFVNEPEFKRLVEAGEFLEYAVVFGNMYGTLKKPVQDALADGQMVLLEIDVQGAMQVHKMFDDSLGIFILPPDEEDLLKRMRARGRDDESSILHRFTEAKQEIRTAQAGQAYEMFVVNQTVDNAVVEIKRGIAEFLARRSRNV